MDRQPTIPTTLAARDAGGRAVPRISEASAQLGRVAARTRAYIQQASADNTRRAYRSDWSDFELWCRAEQLAALPATPETVALYLTALAEGCRPSTLHRRLVAISRVHRAAAHEPPTRAIVVQETMKGIRRALGTWQQRKKPIVTDILRQLIAVQPPTIFGTRDRAMLLIGFAAALRRSELVALEVADLQIGRDGLVLRLRRSKTDQEGAGQTIGIPYGRRAETCPVRAVERWLRESGIEGGPVFRRISKSGRVLPYRLNDKAVATIVKRSAAAAGYDPAQFGGHSLRAGLATQAAISGASERVIMRQTGHRSLEMVRRYIRDGDLFRENAVDFTDL